MNRFIFLLITMVIFSTTSQATILRDEIIEDFLSTQYLKKPYINLDYNYESTEKIPIKLKPTKKISTKEDEIQEGQIITFKVTEDVFYKNQRIVEKGTIATAKIETYITKGMNGLPGTIIIDKFSFENIPQEKLKGTIIKKGLNFALLVFPIKWALTPLPPTGSLTNIIFGCNAKLTPRDKITIYYYPHWAEKT